MHVKVTHHEKRRPVKSHPYVVQVPSPLRKYLLPNFRHLVYDRQLVNSKRPGISNVLTRHYEVMMSGGGASIDETDIISILMDNLGRQLFGYYTTEHAIRDGRL